MANTVFQHKRSGTPSNVPPGLELGELAINYADGLIFYKNTTGQIVSISGSGGNDFGTINANGTLVVADTPGDVLNLVAGNNVTFGVDIVNDIITINASGGGGDISPAFDAANAAFNTANAAFDQANTGDIFRVHTNILTENVTIYTGNNALAAGPITIQSGKSLTIQTNARVIIV
jgi:hypothetical protein